jgi:hypothetical protein
MSALSEILAEYVAELRMYDRIESILLESNRADVASLLLMISDIRRRRGPELKYILEVLGTKTSVLPATVCNHGIKRMAA